MIPWYLVLRKELLLIFPVLFGFLLNKDTGEPILVDAGSTDDQQWAQTYHFQLRRRVCDNLEDGLARYGFKPENIKTVISTHLHWDHGYGVLKLKNAEIIIQRCEIQFAVAPEPSSEEKRFETDIKTTLPYFLRCWQQMTFIDGDVELRPGLQTIFLPGHSPGSMGMLIDGENAKYLIASDLINLEENWAERKICGAATSVNEAHASLEKVERIVNETGAIILPSHDFVSFDLVQSNSTK